MKQLSQSELDARKKTNIKILKVIGIVFGLFILLIMCSESTSNSSSTKAASVKKVQKIDKGIDGMSPVDIYLDLEKKGFKIDKKHDSEIGTFYYCDKNDFAITYNVTIFENIDDKVEQIKISAALTGQENKKIIAVKPFLKYISTVPYDGSDTAKITKWVDDNFNKDGDSIVIGQAKFSIHGGKFSKVIVIQKV